MVRLKKKYYSHKILLFCSDMHERCVFNNLLLLKRDFVFLDCSAQCDNWGEHTAFHCWFCLRSWNSTLILKKKKSTTPLQPYGANCIIYPPRWHERMTQQKLNNRRLFTLGTEARGSRSDANFLFLLLSPGSQSNDTILSGMNSYH